MLNVKKITPAIGGIIQGVNFSQPNDEATQDAIYRALLEHKVIFSALLRLLLPRI